jgi:ubiquinone/menaquinone biosynthesis C-methylase UbiE
MLANEADMAAARRLRVVVEYLDIQAGERVLDCGCGLGWFTHVLRELHDCRLAATDSDLPRLRVARRETRPDVSITASDVVALPYPDGLFDKIVLSEVLEHVPEDEAALREVARVTKPGGLIAITVPNRNYPFLWDPVNRTRERLGLAPIREGFFGGLWTNHLRLYRREELLALVERCGLVAEESRQHVHRCFPFAHNLVYGVGMRLVQSGVLTEEDRFRYDRPPAPAWNPLELGRRIFRAIDRTNHPISDEAKTAVILSVKARKPLGR